MSKATNAAVMKNRNQKLLLNLIRQGDWSRVDLAKETGLTKASVTILTDPMVKEGLLTEEDAPGSGVGRRPVYLRLVPQAVCAFGVYVTRQHISIGLVTLTGQVLWETQFRHSALTPSAALERAAAEIRTQIPRVPGKLLGVGMAVPGPVDYRRGNLLTPPNFSSWHNAPAGEILSRLCGVPVLLEETANACALAELYFGCCSRDAHYAYLIVDDGIGSGIVVDGHLYRGQSGRGNELGHTSIAMDGRPCACGNQGCLETYASIPALLKDTSYQNWADVLSCRDENLMDREASYLSCALTNLVNLFDLDKIVLGGEIAEHGEPLAQRIAQKLNARIITGRKVTVIPAQIRDRAALAAAAMIRSFYA